MIRRGDFFGDVMKAFGRDGEQQGRIVDLHVAFQDDELCIFSGRTENNCIVEMHLVEPCKLILNLVFMVCCLTNLYRSLVKKYPGKFDEATGIGCSYIHMRRREAMSQEISDI